MKTSNVWKLKVLGQINFAVFFQLLVKVINSWCVDRWRENSGKKTDAADHAGLTGEVPINRIGLFQFIQVLKLAT